MAVTLYSRHDTSILFREQSTWGTAEAGSAAFTHMGVASSVIDPDIQERLPDRSNSGSRVLVDTNVSHDFNGSAPKFSVGGDAKKLDLADSLYAVMQQVSEAIGTPFLKTYTFPTTQPDFTAGEGYIRTLVEDHPAASTSKAIRDCISTELVLKVAPGTGESRLQFTESIMGRGQIDDVFNTTGTNVRTAQSFFYFDQIQTFTGNAAALNPLDLEIKISQPRTLGASVEQGGTGDFLTFAIPEYMVECTFKVMRDAASQTLQALRGTDINHQWILQWGDGTADGTLKFTIQGQLAAADSENDDINSITFKLKGVAISGGAVALTVLLADASDRSW